MGTWPTRLANGKPAVDATNCHAMEVTSGEDDGPTAGGDCSGDRLTDATGTMEPTTCDPWLPTPRTLQYEP